MVLLHLELKVSLGPLALQKRFKIFLATGVNYLSKESAIGYKILCDLARFLQHPEQSIHDFLSKIQPLWNQMALSELV